MAFKGDDKCSRGTCFTIFTYWSVMIFILFAFSVASFMPTNHVEYVLGPPIIPPPFLPA